MKPRDRGWICDIKNDRIKALVTNMFEYWNEKENFCGNGNWIIRSITNGQKEAIIKIVRGISIIGIIFIKWADMQWYDIACY